MPETQPDNTAVLQKQLDKLIRRQKRNERHAWAEGFLTAVCGMLKPGDIAIDLGANVGDVSARLLDTGAKVIAFDPEPWAIEKLQTRFGENKQFELHNAAVGVKDGSISLFRAENFENNEKNASVKSTIVQGGRMIDDSAQNGIEVRQINFIDFLKTLIANGQEVSFLKMDIEGAELELLRAMDKEGLFAHIRCCVAETHERKFKELRPEFRELRRNFSAKYAPHHVNLDWI